MSRKPVTLITICAIAGAAAVATAPASASFAGRDGLLVYTTTFRGEDVSRTIGTMRPNGTHRHALRSLPAASDPAWAPKGRRIAFSAATSTDPNSYEIYTMNADGSNLRQVTHNAVADLAPSWGPKGGRLAVVQVAYDGNGERIPSSPELRLISLATGAESLVVHTPMNDAAWAPDGRLIAYADEESAYVVPPSGGTPLKVATLAPGSFLSDLDWLGNTSYSAGGTLSFTQYGPSGGCDEGCSNGVWAVNHVDRYFDPPNAGYSPSVLDPERVTPWRGGSARHLLWSPSGRRAVFCAAGSGYPIPWELHAMRYDGTHARTVRRAPCPSDWQALPPRS